MNPDDGCEYPDDGCVCLEGLGFTHYHRSGGRMVPLPRVKKAVQPFVWVFYDPTDIKMAVNWRAVYQALATSP